MELDHEPEPLLVQLNEVGADRVHGGLSPRNGPVVGHVLDVPQLHRIFVADLHVADREQQV